MMVRTRRTKLIELALASGTTALVMGLSVASAAQAQASAPATTYPYTFTNATNPATTTVIAALPKRVVVFGALPQTLDVLATLGIKPIAYEGNGASVIDGTNSDGLPLWVNGGELDGAQDLGHAASNTPNLEPIAALDPDLIVTSQPGAAAQLGTVAPTIVVNTEVPTTSSGGLTHEFFDEGMEEELGPVFNETARAQAVVTRLHALTDTLKPFVQGTTVDLPEFPAGGQNFYNITSDQSLGGFFDAAGATLEQDTEAPAAAGFQVVSTELLPGLTAEKVVANQFSTAMTYADVQALPLYSQIPAVSKGQFYFTGWFGEGNIGMANTIIELQKQVFGVTGLQATLAGTGKDRTSRSGYAYVDVGSDGTGVCWDFGMATGSPGNPKQAVIETTASKPKVLLTLGHGYSTTGCASFKSATVAKLLQHPGSYRVATETVQTKQVKVHIKHSKRTKRVKQTVTTVFLQGTVAPQSPAFFGNGKDTLYDMQTV